MVKRIIFVFLVYFICMNQVFAYEHIDTWGSKKDGVVAEFIKDGLFLKIEIYDDELNDEYTDSIFILQRGSTYILERKRTEDRNTYRNFNTFRNELKELIIEIFADASSRFYGDKRVFLMDENASYSPANDRLLNRTIGKILKEFEITNKWNTSPNESA